MAFFILKALTPVAGSTKAACFYHFSSPGRDSFSVGMEGVLVEGEPAIYLEIPSIADAVWNAKCEQVGGNHAMEIDYEPERRPTPPDYFTELEGHRCRVGDVVIYRNAKPPMLVDAFPDRKALGDRLLDS